MERCVRSPRPPLDAAIACAVIDEQFEGGAGAVAKDEQSAGERVLRQRAFAQGKERIEPLPEINGLAGEQNPELGNQLNHRTWAVSGAGNSSRESRAPWSQAAVRPVSFERRRRAQAPADNSPPPEWKAAIAVKRRPATSNRNPSGMCRRIREQACRAWKRLRPVWRACEARSGEVGKHGKPSRVFKAGLEFCRIVGK